MAILLLGIITASSAYSSPLFESDEALEISLTGPLGSIARERKKTERNQYAFELKVGETSLPVMVRVRGKSRRELCPFPPLRLKFEDEEALGTPFERQTTLKLVTHCRNNDDHSENNVLDEYLAYRIYNVVSEAGFRVRLLRINYTDTDGRHRNLDRPYYAFAIEKTKDLEARLGGRLAELDSVIYSRLDPLTTAKMSVFQYLVANSDWSFIRNPGDSACCHNVDLVDTGSRLLPVPRDFDMTGLVNAKYAKPPPSANIRNITTRVFRGYCRSPGSVVALALDQIVAMQEEIMAVTEETPALTMKDRSTRSEFISSFFKAAGKDREKLVRQFDRECIGER